MRRALLLGLSVSLTLACEELPEFNEDLLEQYRDALPDPDQLKVPFPRVNGVERPTASSARFPRQAETLADELDPTVDDLLTLLQLLVDADPRAFNDQRNEFRWGPFPFELTLIADDALFVSMRRRGEETDAIATDLHRPFEYVYQLDVGLEDDDSTRVPFVWGGFNPDPNDPEIGNGVLLYDLEAQYTFELDHDSYQLWNDRGRIGLLYDRRGAADAPLETAVSAALRHYVSRDDPGLGAVDLDYGWGTRGPADDRYHHVSFVAVGDLDDAGDTLPEVLLGDMTFSPDGHGRAEATAVQGDIPPQLFGVLIECWNNALETQYSMGQLVDYVSQTPIHELYPTEGGPNDCSRTSLQELPGREAFPEAVRDAFADLLDQGIPLWQDR